VREFLYGRQPVRECLRAHRRHIHRLLLAEGIKESGIPGEILDSARRLGIPVARTPRRQLDEMTDAHQGVALETGAYPYVAVEDLVRWAHKQAEPPFLLALDHLQDPHNLGALLRSAEAVGAHGVILPERRAVGVTPAVVAASAGASEHMRVTQVTNLVRTLEALKQENLWSVGLDAGLGSCRYDQIDLNRPLVLVVGAEGSGLSQLMRQRCDYLVRLPMRGRMESLNASVAGGIALYAAWAARGFVGDPGMRS
jgi:23S rRNA (guanosine2251-2'-O)-methyltransferase